MNDEDICDLDKSFSGNTLSTTRKTNGAIAVFLPGVAEKYPNCWIPISTWYSPASMKL